MERKRRGKEEKRGNEESEKKQKKFEGKEGKKMDLTVIGRAENIQKKWSLHWWIIWAKS